ncbi:GGDEF domain-containing protein [Dactylosporangium sp. AC04546]|uniref:GGDEF domain-containing protein n=1 Tax=Dactylosporangium sp. AC04546 TaxID=2862460 RepID=UPI001EE0461A|nr:GGDEF domain-containing protein [Dactylosporangium sp. AC04546]WVK88541.1 GGDEF domain-containing protein [Dactylosporangium sp. AC04546]
MWQRPARWRRAASCGPVLPARDRRTAARSVSWFFAVGGSVVGGCALLVPGFAGGTTAGVVTTVLTATAMVAAAVVLRALPERIPDAFWVGVPFVALGIIGSLNLVTHDVSVSAHLYYLWPLLYAATLLRYDVAYLLLASACAADAAVTFALQPFDVGVTDVAALLTAYVVSTVVVTSLRRRADTLVARLEEQALTDPLTGLPNRRAFDHDLARALGASRRGGTEHCLLIVDVDHFKTINDTWGHATGDEVLVAVAAALRRTAHPAETVARLGGDEFAMLVAGDVARARRHAAALRLAVARGSALPGGPPTLSIGVASTAAGATTAEALLAAADRALYRAKLDGRDRVALETPAAGPARQNRAHETVGGGSRGAGRGAGGGLHHRPEEGHA